MKSIISPWDYTSGMKAEICFGKQSLQICLGRPGHWAFPDTGLVSMCNGQKRTRSEEANVLFSRTRQNSQALWLSKVLSRSTATLGSLCFSRRYWGPGRSKGREEGRRLKQWTEHWENTTRRWKADNALGKHWCLLAIQDGRVWVFFPTRFHILVCSIIRSTFVQFSPKRDER